MESGTSCKTTKNQKNFNVELYSETLQDIKNIKYNLLLVVHIRIISPNRKHKLSLGMKSSCSLTGWRNANKEFRTKLKIEKVRNWDFRVKLWGTVHADYSKSTIWLFLKVWYTDGYKIRALHFQYKCFGLSFHISPEILTPQIYNPILVFAWQKLPYV